MERKKIRFKIAQHTTKLWPLQKHIQPIQINLN